MKEGRVPTLVLAMTVSSTLKARAAMKEGRVPTLVAGSGQGVDLPHPAAMKEGRVPTLVPSATGNLAALSRPQ